MTTLAFKKGFSSIETKTISLYAATTKDIKIHYHQKAKQVPPNEIPVGSIQWVTSVLGYTPIPDHYPDWLCHLLHRKVWKSFKWPMEKDIFVKPYDKPKRFEHQLTTGTYKGKKKPPYWCSTKVNFIDEWRYYISNGEIIYAAWYQGKNEDSPPPILDISIPVDYCGVIDMGILSTGELALVEAGEPYGMGWYGSLLEGKIYTNFLITGWKWLKYKNNLLF